MQPLWRGCTRHGAGHEPAPAHALSRCAARVPSRRCHAMHALRAATAATLMFLRPRFKQARKATAATCPRRASSRPPSTRTTSSSAGGQPRLPASSGSGSCAAPLRRAGREQTCPPSHQPAACLSADPRCTCPHIPMHAMPWLLGLQAAADAWAARACQGWQPPSWQAGSAAGKAWQGPQGSPGGI